MNRRVMFLSTAFALAIAIATNPAGAQGTRTPGSGNGSHDRQGGSQHAAAVAHLQGVGAVTGWGRIMVKDQVGPTAGERSAAIRLFALVPEAAFTVEVDGVLLTTVTSDANGDAWALLGAGAEATGPFPTELPPTAELVGAVVLDASLAPTLAGDFVAMAGSGGWGQHGDLVYAERVVLANASSDWPRGVARVGRSSDDEQLFESNAGGLEAGATYLVLVDGLLAAQVTADAVGHAGLSLATGSSDAILPAELTPIEELRLVEWTTRDGAVVLAGSFTGTSQLGDGSGGGHGDGGGPGDGDGSGDCDGDGGGPGDGDGSGDCDGDGGGNDGEHGGGDGGHGDGGQGGGHGGGTP